jgi:hypothetical protein
MVNNWSSHFLVYHACTLHIDHYLISIVHWFSHNQMKANPDKFQASAIGSKTSNETISFNLDGNKIDCVPLF